MPLKIVDGEPWIDPGELRHRITFLEQVASQDLSGTVFAYEPAKKPECAYAAMEMLPGTDVIKSGQDISQVHMTVTIRYRSGVATNRHFRTPNGSEFIIQAVENVLQRNLYLRLTCLGLGAND